MDESLEETIYPGHVFLLTTKQQLGTERNGTSTKNSFILQWPLNALILICPSKVCRIYVNGRVVAHASED